MKKIRINNSKFLNCPECGNMICEYNDTQSLIKRAAFVYFNKETCEITVKCTKCKKEIKIP